MTGMRRAILAAMKSSRARNTGPELSLRRTLWDEGVCGWRLDWNKAPGRSDVAFPGRRLAVFVNGCL